MKRNLQIVKLTPIALSFCESCKAKFQSTQAIEDDAEAEMKKAFETHTCNPALMSGGANCRHGLSIGFARKHYLLEPLWYSKLSA